MAASLHSIPLPTSTDDESLTWDQSIADIPSIDPDDDDDTPPAAASIKQRNSLTFHAVAHGRSVVGTLPRVTENNKITTWQTKFEHDIAALSSNSDGSVIAVATKSHVSLIKGCDGSILATRQIAASDNKSRSSSSTPGVVFITRNPQHNNGGRTQKDALVVFRTDNSSSDIILISNIDGASLNSSDLNSVKEAAGEMSIHALSFPGVTSVNGITGVYVNEETVRFFVADDTLRVYDVNLVENVRDSSELVTDDLLSLIPGDNWRCNDSIEMCIDDNCDMGYYLTVAVCNEKGLNGICWFDVLDLSLSAQYVCQSKLRAMKAVRSYNSDKCVAAVFATKDAVPKIHVVQSLVGKDGKVPNDSNSMVLFTIEADSGAQSVDLTGPPATEDYGPYAFRYLNRFNDKDNTCREFISGEQARAGMVHYLLTNNDFDEAYTCINELNDHPANAMVSSPIHHSMAAFWQFRYVLSKGNFSSKENMIEAKECLRRLASSAISGGDTGVDSLTRAAQFLMSWPKNQANKDVNTSQTISIQEVCMALSAMSTTITGVIEVLSAAKITKLQEMKQRLDDRQTALRALRDISDVDGLDITTDDPYLAIGSLADLLNCLVSQGAFKSAERLMKSQWGKQISVNVAASSALRIPVSVDPRCFLPWLCDLILPTLTIGHPLLETIRAWSCGAADKYDEENASSGLDSAIVLLQAVSKATARLAVDVNTSFGHRLQFRDDSEEFDVPDTPTHNGSFFNSFDSKASSSRSFYNRPTVLNIGMISGMKSKGSKVFSAKRVGLPSATSPDPSLLHVSDVTIDDDLDFDCVEDKLKEAMRLKQARSLGIARECLTLKHYSSRGEQYIIKELVKVALLHIALHSESESEEIVNQIRMYAGKINANFDEAVHEHAIELCESSRDNIPRILHQTEVLCRWCSSLQIRCLIVLKMLRKALVSIQRPPDLSGIASEALRWVTDGNVKSELEEALRLLTVDTLVRKYCGNGAQAFFRVHEASHTRRLVQHITNRHIDTHDVLSDLLVLCDAFHASVSKVDTCVSFIQRVMFAKSSENGTQRLDHVAALMEELYLKDFELAEDVGKMVIDFCTQTIDDCRHLMIQGMSNGKQQAIVASSTACSILTVMSKDRKIRKQRAGRIDVPTMLREFQRLSKLQTECGIFMSHAELNNSSSCVSVLLGLLDPCINLLQRKSFDDKSLKDNLKSIIATAKHWCAVLCDVPSKVSTLWSRSVGTLASKIAKTTSSSASLLLLQVSGVLDERPEHSSFHSVVSVALTLFGRASMEASNLSKSMSFMSSDEENISTSLFAMKSLAQASMLLREHVILVSPPSMLSPSISLVNLAEFACDVCCRADLGVGEKLERYINLLQSGSRKHKQLLKTCGGVLSDSRGLPNSPVLHPSWYVGDGLLLRPLDALVLSMATFESILDAESNIAPGYSSVAMNASDIIHVLESRGAQTTALRVGSISDSVALSRNKSCVYSDHLVSLGTALAQRSLGGIESGLTSGAVDHLLSISFLIGNLPKDTAFNLYQASLPSAIGQRDFRRISTLASIGVYCGEGTFSSGKSFPWCKQIKFIKQCQSFVIHSKMWGILSRFKVTFDPSVFTQTPNSSDVLEGYCEKLIWNAATELDVDSVLRLATKFVKYYNIDKHLPASTLMQFLLSAPDGNMYDIRSDFAQVEATVRKSCLPLLPVVNQSKVLRKCVVKLEASACCSDYDRHLTTLTLYSECLSKLTPFMTSESRTKAHMRESERIGRRLNSLILLSSIFDKDPPEKKPQYSKLFEPLPNDPSQPISSNYTMQQNLLDLDSSQYFDPLRALHDVLEEDSTNSIAASLSPLCSILGLPAGYIHARALVIKFLKLNRIKETLPSPESSVFIVIKKLALAADRADLAWWCATKYDHGSREQLKCVEIAYTNATLAAEQIEMKGNAANAEEENAIDRVKRFAVARNMLSDIILVSDILLRHPSISDTAKTSYNSIIKGFRDSLQSDEYKPENLVKELLVEGSLTAAKASLDSNNLFTTSHFRSLALLIHDACEMLSERYSHINIGKCVRLFTRRWLVHGDDMISGSSADSREQMTDAETAPISTGSQKVLNTINEDNEVTSEFVMDIGKMNISSGDQPWAYQKSSADNTGIKSSYESCIFETESQRERSQLGVSRTSLRIAFLMCFAQDVHQFDTMPCKEDGHDENANANVKAAKRGTKTKSTATQQRVNCFEGDLALSHARELLGIVFAKQGSVTSKLAFMLEDSYDESFSTQDEDKGPKNKALSFAMRHRALRVASILCPYDVLLRVMLEEQYVRDLDDDHVSQIAFGSFIAMEIEAMGLPLPFADLSQLSQTHFPSLARTLWKNQAGISASKHGGRLHLLLLELAVNHETVDWEMVTLMFGEISRNELPRSLLFACECLIESKAFEKAVSANRNEVTSCISKAAKKIFEFMSNAIHSNAKSNEFDAFMCSTTIDRHLRILEQLSDSDVVYFTEAFGSLAGDCKDCDRMELYEVLASAAVRTASHLSNPQSFSLVSDTIESVCDGKKFVHDMPTTTTTSSCAESIRSYEKSFASERYL